MKAFKGFLPDLTCRGFQYAEGQTYEHVGPVSARSSGFHACESPLEVFAYYPPGTSVFHRVTLGGKTSRDGGDSKVAASKLTVGARIGLPGLAEAHVEYVRERIDESKKQTKVSDTASNTGDYSAASNTGNQSAASNTGYQSAASNTGNQSAASNTGYQSAASNTGYQSAASNTGYQSAASNTGDYSAAMATGWKSTATVEGSDSVAVALGGDSKASGAEGCWLVLAERDTEGHLLGVKSVRVDGKRIKAGAWYALRDGKVVKA